ncbi:MAG: efflux RND transporter periplasmic adaptor subunit [Planctomycetota bacterium]
MPPRHAARLCGLSLLLPALAPAQEPPTPVHVQPVQREVREPKREVIGELRSKSRALVAAIEPGKVVEIGFRDGEAVKQGQMLARVDDRRLREDVVRTEADLKVKRAQIEIERTQARTTAADLEAWRAAEAARKGSVSELALRGAERDAAVAAARLQVAEADVARSEADLERLRIQLEDTVIRAPFDGAVVERRVQPGEWLAAGAAVAVVVEGGALEAWVEVPETLAAGALGDGTDIAIRIDAVGMQVKPASLRVIPDVDPRSRRFKLVATLDGAHPQLLPGMSVIAELPGGTPRAMIKVPVDALVRDAGGTFVYKVITPPQSPPLAQPVTVRIAFRRDGFAFLDADTLAESDQVVVEGNERLRPMAPIAPLPPAGATQGGGGR